MIDTASSDGCSFRHDVKEAGLFGALGGWHRALWLLKCCRIGTGIASEGVHLDILYGTKEDLQHISVKHNGGSSFGLKKELL